ncbi:uncharacterized protein LOC124831853 [Vigna umbellata]|uniref:uncharacterized protein LOC124831853 n=1 Tax=Vigna umbellata TaxID=87088 RepID=UPI001F5FA9BC|nr:uncharacterized protein LOC124831853 [Vigna umbellata]
MYADRVENGGRRSVKERLNGNGISGPTRHHQQRQITGKRFAILTSCRGNDSGNMIFFYDDHGSLIRKKSYAPKMRDLRERLSGTMTVQPTNVDPPKSKTVKPSSKSVGAEAPAAQIKRPADPAPKRSRKADSSIDDFLLSLGLEKYIITFQAEEVCVNDSSHHMTDEDLKAMGIPMYALN